jgi:hypothetical protein
VASITSTAARNPRQNDAARSSASADADFAGDRNTRASSNIPAREANHPDR